MTSEAAAQQAIRLEAGRLDLPMWRNNSGACRDETGRLIRYGLGNDSAKINAVMKSSDLIGIAPRLIMPHHVGQTWGVFAAVEVKAPGWFGVKNDRERAQEVFMRHVIRYGGLAGFATSVADFHRIMGVGK